MIDLSMARMSTRRNFVPPGSTGSSALGNSRPSPSLSRPAPITDTLGSQVAALQQEGVLESLSRRVLYRDGLILVIDKPAGIAVHPGPGGGPDLESRFDQLRFGLPHPP